MSLRTILHQYSTVQEHNYQTESGFTYRNINSLVKCKVVIVVVNAGEKMWKSLYDNRECELCLRLLILSTSQSTTQNSRSLARILLAFSFNAYLEQFDLSYFGRSIIHV